MITQENYFKEVKTINYKKLPGPLKEAYGIIREGSSNYKTWKKLEADKEFINTYFDKLNEYLGKQKSDKPEIKQPDKKVVVEKVKPPVGKKKKSVQKPSADTTGKKRDEKGKEQERKQKKEQKADSIPSNMVEKISAEIRFIKRYIRLHGVVKKRKELYNFAKSLQKAIIEKVIRKSSKYAKEIEHIQDELVRAYNEMKRKRVEKINVVIDTKTLKSYTDIVNDYKVKPSVAYIKQFVNLYNEPTKEKANRLSAIINKAIEDGRIKKDDIYYKETESVRKKLNEYIASGKEIIIPEYELNGLMGIAGCGDKKKAPKLLITK